MELDFDDTAVRGLHGYVRLVSLALGLHGECWAVQPDTPMSAYIALDERLGRFPDRDVALWWDEHGGWAAGIEVHSGEDLSIVAYLGQDLLPSPETVAAWARRLFHSQSDPEHPGEQPARPGGDDLRPRLAAYLSALAPARPRTVRSRGRSPDDRELFS